MTNDIKINTLPDNQKNLFDKLSKLNWINSFYLVGGTAIALFIEHRESFDFDFFIEKDFNTKEIINRLIDIGNFELFSESENTINGSLIDTKISFFKYSYPLLKNTISYRKIRIADLLDLALMKIAAISGRGSKKDFVDFYYLLEKYRIDDLLKYYEKKYGIAITNHYHIIKSLVYFEDAEIDYMPLLFKELSWEQIKERIEKEVKKLKLY